MSAYSSAILADNPLRYYRLDDTNTTAVDSLTSAQNGTYSGTYTQSQASLLPGDSDAAVSFGGGHVTFPTTSLPTGASAWSIECWCKPSSFPSPFGFALAYGGNGSGTNDCASVGFNSSAQGRYGLHNNEITLGTATAGHVYYLALTYNGTTVTAWFGDLTAGTLTSSTLNVTLGIGASPLGYIGQFIDGTDQFAGVVDEAAIYGSCLSSTQVTNHFNAASEVAVTPQVSGTSDYLCQARLNWRLGISYPTPPANLYLALFISPPNGAAGSGTEYAGNGYARAAVPGNASGWKTPTQPGGAGTAWQTALLQNQPSFVANGADWSGIGWFAWFDAPSGGNMLDYGSFQFFQTVKNHTELPLNAGNFIITSR